MTIMSFLLLTILFMTWFIYFSGLNPQMVTIFYYPGESITSSLAVIAVGCILVGVFIGFVLYLLSALRQMVKNLKADRQERRNREVISIYREGVNRLFSGDMKKARVHLQRALDRDPARIETYLAMANVHVQDNQLEEAVALLGRARNVDPRSLEVLFKLASVYEALQRWDDAAQAYRSILGKADNNRKALRALRDLRMRAGEWKESFELQKKILKFAEGTTRQEEEERRMLSLRYEVACQGLSGDEKEIKSARVALQEIVKDAPDFLPAHVSLGDVLRRLGAPLEASSVWEEGYRSLGRGVFLERLEALFLDEGDPATLLSFYRDFVREKSNDLMLRFFYGKLCLRLEMIEEGLEQLQLVESSGVDSPQIHLLLAEGHSRRGRLDIAIQQYKKALGVTSRLAIGYVCDSCGEESREWQSRCPECGEWGSLSVVGRQSLRGAMAATTQLREIHHGERETWGTV
ncbi:MAG: DUF1049 domain-containing protein [Desulfuromonadales bacterium]|nr:DUF1049 domain-containing protein [Desulfuromonadales bacterium]